MFLEYEILQSLFHKPGWVGAIHKCQPLCKLHCGQLAAGFLLGTVISHQAIAPICVHTQAKIWPQSFQPPKSYKDVKNKLNTMKGQICLGPFVTECSIVISKSKYEPFLPRRNLATHNESRTVKNRCCFCFKSHTSSSGSQISLSLIHRKNTLHVTTFSYTNTSQPSMKQHLPLLPVSMLMFTIPFYFSLFLNCLSWFQDLVMCCNPTV